MGTPPPNTHAKPHASTAIADTAASVTPTTATTTAATTTEATAPDTTGVSTTTTTTTTTHTTAGSDFTSSESPRPPTTLLLKIQMWGDDSCRYDT